MAILAVAAVAFTGCKKTEKTPEKEVELSLSVSPLEVGVGEKFTYEISSPVAPAENISISITSSNTAVATVASTVTLAKGATKVTGDINAIAEGTSKISITAGNVKIKVADQQVTVKKEIPAVVALSINATVTEVAPGETIDFTVTSPIAPASDLTVNLVSSSTEIATVPASVVLKGGETSVTGQISALAQGNATITISASGVEIPKPTLDITVTAAPVTEPTLSIGAVSTTTVVMGETIKFKVSTPIAAANDIVVNVTSSNTNVATVPAQVTLTAGQLEVQGDITSVAIGNADITISANEVAIGTAVLKISVVDELAVYPTYCAPTFSTYQYACLADASLGTAKIGAGMPAYFTNGESDPVPFSPDWKMTFQPWADYITGNGDAYTLAIFADWNLTGTFTQVHTQQITAVTVGGSTDDPSGEKTVPYNGTLTVPAGASSIGVIRMAVWYQTDGLGTNGCGKVESGSVIDFYYNGLAQ